MHSRALLAVVLATAFFVAAPLRSARAREPASKPDVVSVAEAESFAAYLTGLLARPDAEAAFAKVDLDRVVACAEPYVVFSDAQRKSARDDAARLARAALAYGPALHVSTAHDD